MKRGKIKLFMKDGIDLEVDALITGCGCLAVHKYVNRDRELGGYYTITHIPTGKAIALFEKQKEAKLIAEKLEETGEFNTHDESKKKLETLLRTLEWARREIGIYGAGG